MPLPIARELRNWKAAARLFTIARNVLALLAVVSSALAAFKLDNPLWWKKLIPLWSLIAAICAGLIGLFDFDRTAKAYRKASDVLNQACVEFQVDKNKTEAELLKAYKEAAKLRNSPDR